ncbi:hypothetical protein FRX31_022420 [Thalictrum thalictroides]|uniref:Uncharacterized protein n=1 Tax=Thalictrum thalictroides TaxID=46969 RepID=A0A7J6VSW9_THATH|nr:hypothetical protein FRX31_022420 [Thalictrum thalictroides]
MKFIRTSKVYSNKGTKPSFRKSQDDNLFEKPLSIGTDLGGVHKLNLYLMERRDTNNMNIKGLS